MKRFLLLLGLALSASAARAQNEPEISIGYIEEYAGQTIGGGQTTTTVLKFTGLKVLGTWTFADKAGQHGYIYVDDAHEAKWENSDLVVPLASRLFDVTRMQRWKTGETALILDDLDEAAVAALKRQSNFRAPIHDQLEVKWQPLENSKVRLIVSNVGSQTLQPALHNALYLVTATRDGKRINADIAPNGIDEAPKFEPLQPDAKWQRDLTLNWPIEFSQAGHYKVEVETQFPVRNGGTPDEPAWIIVKFPVTFEFDVPKK